MLLELSKMLENKSGRRERERLKGSCAETAKNLWLKYFKCKEVIDIQPFNDTKLLS